MINAPLLDTGSVAMATGVPSRLLVYPDGLEVRTLRPPRRGIQRLSYHQIAQVSIVRRLLFADLVIETRGGGALTVAGMTKAAAEEAQALIWEKVTAAA